MNRRFRTCLFICLWAAILFIRISLDADIILTKYFSLQYEAKDEKNAQNIAERFDKIIWSVNREIGFYNISGIKVLLCSSNDEFTDLMTLSGKLPDQTVAFAVPKFKTITLKNPKDMPAKSDYYKILKHEYCHILLHHIAPQSRIPLWFDEGFAQYFAKQWNFTKEVEFLMDALQGNTLNLSKYNYHYPKYKNKVGMFYLQSYYNFKKLIADYDFVKFQKFLEMLNQTEKFSISFYRIYGCTVQQFLEKVQNSIKPHLILALFYSGFGFIWTLIPFLLLIAFIRKQIKKRRVEKRWSEEEDWKL